MPVTRRSHGPSKKPDDKKEKGETDSNIITQTQTINDRKKLEKKGISKNDTDDYDSCEDTDPISDNEYEEVTRSPKSKLKLKNDNEGDAPELYPRRRRSFHETRKVVSEQVTFQRESPKKKEILRIPESGHIVESSNYVQLESPLSSSNFSKKNIMWLVLITFFLFFIISAAYPFLTYKAIPMNISEVQQKFPKQENELWKAIASGISDTVIGEHPTTYIFLHEYGAEKTMKNLLTALSKYATCHLSKCEYLPIKLNSEVLNSSEFSGNEDYGTLIARFKEDLENTGVMIIENLDEFPEKYAQSLHTFCDEFTPLVKKSVFFFTLRISKFGNPLFDMSQVENTLRKKWKGIDEDVFGPLFTRISGAILRIYAEKINVQTG